MTASTVVQAVLLGIVVLSCWLGVLGMLRMRQPTQALHYLSLPAAGVMFLVAAVFVAQGSTQVAWKTLLIAVILVGINSIVTHASARAFRAREIGHWEPCDGDAFELVTPGKRA